MIEYLKTQLYMYMQEVENNNICVYISVIIKLKCTRIDSVTFKAAK